jgi:hypothetical protein
MWLPSGMGSDSSIMGSPSRLSWGRTPTAGLRQLQRGYLDIHRAIRSPQLSPPQGADVRFQQLRVASKALGIRGGAVPEVADENQQFPGLTSIKSSTAGHVGRRRALRRFRAGLDDTSVIPCTKERAAVPGRSSLVSFDRDNEGPVTIARPAGRAVFRIVRSLIPPYRRKATSLSGWLLGDDVSSLNYGASPAFIPEDGGLIKRIPVQDDHVRTGSF